MKKSVALKKIEDLKKKYEDVLEDSSKLLADSVKHKHMFNDIEYCVSDTQHCLDMLLELEREIKGDDDKEKVEAFKMYGMDPVLKQEYDFKWDDEEKEDKEDKEED